MDFVAELPRLKGKHTVLTIVDRLSKSVHFVVLSRLPSSKGTANLLVHQVFRIHGIPADIV